MLFMIASKATSFMPAVKAYGWKPVAQTLMDTSGKRLLNFVTAGRAYGNTYFFDPNPGLTKTLVPASPTAIPTGQTFTYRLTWRCAGSISPQDDCYNMRITDTLPPGIEFVSLPGVVAPVQSITGAGGVLIAQFVPTVPAGSTGVLDIQVRYRPLVTPNGVSSPNTAMIEVCTFANQSCAPNYPISVDSNTITTTSVATDKASASKSLVGGAVLDETTTYRIDVCNNTSGTIGVLGLQNVTVTDTLRTDQGMIYLNSSPAATAVVNMDGTTTLTWNIATVAGSCQGLNINVRYPSAIYGDAPKISNVTNSATVNGTLIDGTPRNFNVGPIGHGFSAPNPSGTISKSAASSDTGSPDQNVGGGVNFNVSISNNGNVTLDSQVIDDPIPNELNLTSVNTGSAVSGRFQLNGINTWIPVPLVALGASVAVNGTNFPGLGVGYVSRVEYTFTNVAPGASNGIVLSGTIINPPHGGGGAYTLPKNDFCNTATLITNKTGFMIPNANAQACLKIVRDLDTAYPRTTKSVVSGSSTYPGQVVRYQIDVNPPNATNSVAIQEPVVADLIDANLDYIGNVAVTKSGGASAGCLPGPTVPTVTPNYNSGRTLLKWSWAGTTCSVPPGESVTIQFDARVKPGTLPGNYRNYSAIVDVSNPASQFMTDSDPKRFCVAPPSDPSQPYLADPAITDGNPLANGCVSGPADVSIISFFQLDSRKGVKGQLNFDPAFADGSPGVADFFQSGTTFVAETVRGGSIFWALEIFNQGNVSANNLDVIDILPFNNPPPGNSGAGTGISLGTTWQPFFLAPIDTSTAPPGTKVYYSTDPNPCRNLDS